MKKNLLFLGALYFILFMFFLLIVNSYGNEMRKSYLYNLKMEISTVFNEQLKNLNPKELNSKKTIKHLISSLEKQRIYTAIAIPTKLKNKQSKFQGVSKNGLIILNISSDIALNLLNSPEIINTNYYKDFFVIKVPIKASTATFYIIAFAKDIFNLNTKEKILNILMIALAIIFFYVFYIIYKILSENKNMIDDLKESVTKEIKQNLDLLYLDSLTGAYKKSRFDIDKLRYKNYYAVMMNIKNFSQLNTFYGFKTGDKILKETVKTVEKILNRKIYRIHADEFVFFTKDYEKEISMITNYFKTYPIKIDSLIIRLTFTFSVVKNESEDVLRKLSIAQKEAKKHIFKKYVLYQEQNQNNNFIKFNTILYDALYLKQKAQIIPFFQPIVDNITQKPIKYEVLARLKDNEKIYSPFFFLDIAKSSGFLPDLTKEIIDKSFKKAKEQNIDISINITDEDLLIENFEEHLLSCLKECGLKPNNITIEILENITSKDTTKSIELIKSLKDKGFIIAIDDFGVEYSNFERISDLDVDFIKIDGKYIKDIHTNPKNYQIVKAITEFAHAMDIKVIAEYVENKEIFETVKNLNIHYSQGYYFSLPKEM